jgi:hypothetical protein
MPMHLLYIKSQLKDDQLRVHAVFDLFYFRMKYYKAHVRCADTRNTVPRVRTQDPHTAQLRVRVWMACKSNDKNAYSSNQRPMTMTR